MAWKKGNGIVALVLFIALLISLLPACSVAGQDATDPVSPPSSGSDEQKELDMDISSPSHDGDILWKADGIISDGEYSNNADYEGLKVFWASDAEYIYVALQAQTTGWISIAVQPGINMKDADMMLGFVESGKATLIDQYSSGSFGPHRPDTELGGNNDIIDYAGTEEAGRTILEFKRALVTGDSYDHPLTSGENKIIWAYGASDDTSFKHSKRGYGTLDL